MNDLPLHVVDDTATTITLGWTPPPWQEGYVVLIDGEPKANDGKRHASIATTARQAVIGKMPGETKPVSRHTYGIRLLGGQAEGLHPAPQPTGVTSETYAMSIHPNFTQGQDRNEYNSQWAAETGGTYVFDRERNDSFAFAIISQFGESFPTGPHAGRFPPEENDVTSEQGFWGRHLNFHNPSDEHDGWNTPPGNSSFAVDFIDGSLMLNVDANQTKHYLIKKLQPLGQRFSLVGRGVMGRNDGSTRRPGSVQIAYNGEIVVDAQNINTLWRWSDGTAQKKWWVWAGWYTEGIFDGRTCDLTFCYPWLGPDLRTALATRPKAGPGTWNPNEIPITNTSPYSGSNRSGRHPGNKAPRDHSLGPGTLRQVTPNWDTSMLQVPAGWL